MIAFFLGGMLAYMVGIAVAYPDPVTIGSAVMGGACFATHLVILLRD